MKKYIISLLFYSFIQISFAQETHLFTFSKRKEYADKSIKYFTNCDLFAFSRKQISSFEFIDSIEISGNSFYFKNINQLNWYVKIENDWIPICINGDFVNFNIVINDDSLDFHIIKDSIISNLNCIIYEIIPLNYSSSVKTFYWFNRNTGLVYIKGKEYSLIRDDIK